MTDSTDYYDKIIQDLLEQREELDRMIEDMRRQKKFAELRRGIFNSTTATDSANQPPAQIAPIAILAPAIPPPIDTRQPRGGDVTLVGGSSAILSKEGKPLHASKIVEELATMGKVTNIKSLNSTLISDPHQRFRNYGKNTFGLSEWPERLPIDPPSNGNKANSGVSIGDALAQTIRKVGHALKTAELIHEVGKLGVKASKNSIRASLHSDYRKRFVSVEPGVWTLRELLEASNSSEHEGETNKRNEISE